MSEADDSTNKWYRVICHGCDASEHSNRDYWQGARFPSETHVTIKKQVHDREKHGGRDVAEVVEA